MKCEHYGFNGVTPEMMPTGGCVFCEISTLRARVTELTEERDRYSGTDGEADPLAVILEHYAGIEGLGPTGKVVRGLVAEVRKLQVERDDARRDLEAAQVFAVGVWRVVLIGDFDWRVFHFGDRKLEGPTIHFNTRDAALAEARKLAGVK